VTGASLPGERVILRTVRAEDAPRLAEIGAEPEVSRWWPGLTGDAVRELVAGEGDVTAFAVELDGEVIGLAQYWEETDPEYRHAGVDLCLTTARHGQGLGTDTLRTLARHLVQDRGHHRLVIDPALDNAKAIRCYERVGFKRVGVLRRYEQAPDDSWRDGLLLDLLAEELI
jgi:aminoglycoside 6'-N-acetyltransferase